MLREMEELHEESGLACCICREGYRYHPQKVPANFTVNYFEEVDINCRILEYVQVPKHSERNLRKFVFWAIVLLDVLMYRFA